jgi:hypothetical protein
MRCGMRCGASFGAQGDRIAGLLGEGRCEEDLGEHLEAESNVLRR